jgi:hypothetical protein
MLVEVRERWNAVAQIDKAKMGAERRATRVLFSFSSRPNAVFSVCRNSPRAGPL